MTGLFHILLFWLLGNVLSHCIGGYVSGNILGMILLFAALRLRWVDAEKVRPLLADNLWAILVSAVLSTLVVLAVAGRTFQSLNRRR